MSEREALLKAYVAMRIAAALPGVQREYDFADAIASAEQALAAAPQDRHLRDALQSIIQMDTRLQGATSEEAIEVEGRFAEVARAALARCSSTDGRSGGASRE